MNRSHTHTRSVMNVEGGVAKCILFPNMLPFHGVPCNWFLMGFNPLMYGNQIVEAIESSDTVF